jgi:hypothetical protein
MLARKMHMQEHLCLLNVQLLNVQLVLRIVNLSGLLLVFVVQGMH